MRKQKSLSDGLPEKVISDVYKKEIVRHSNQLIQEIRSFIKMPILEGVKETSVEIFPDEYGDGCVSIDFYLMAETTKHIPYCRIC